MTSQFRYSLLTNTLKFCYTVSWWDIILGPVKMAKSAKTVVRDQPLSTISAILVRRAHTGTYGAIGLTVLWPAAAARYPDHVNASTETPEITDAKETIPNKRCADRKNNSALPGAHGESLLSAVPPVVKENKFVSENVITVAREMPAARESRKRLFRVHLIESSVPNGTFGHAGRHAQ